jgi:hypothetical protein
VHIVLHLQQMGLVVCRKVKVHLRACILHHQVLAGMQVPYSSVWAPGSMM